MTDKPRAAGACGKCHTCGTALRFVLDGEEWCPTCGTYRRYRSHGWVGPDAEHSPCPPLLDTCRRCNGTGVIELPTRYGAWVISDTAACPQCAPPDDEPPF